MKRNFFTKIALAVVCVLMITPFALLPSSTLTAFAADTASSHTHCSCGLETCDAEYFDHHNDIDFPVWERDTRMPIQDDMEPDGSLPVHYYLAHDVDMSDKWEVENRGRRCVINLCLYDHTVTNTNSDEETPVIEIWRNGRLHLTTCGRRSMDGDAEITHTEGALGSGVWVGGQETNTNMNRGCFYFYGGNIVRNTSTTNGGGVWVLPRGEFEMYRGSISNNTANGDGGGVYNTGTFDMYGGDIIGNKANGQGDGVYNANIFNMTGGTISSAGVAIVNTGTMTISGGTVSGSQGIRNVDNGTVKLSGNPTISSALGTADICCLSTNEGQIDAEGYTGKTLKVSIDGTTDGQDNFDLMLNKVIVKNTTADNFILVDSMGNTYTDYALVQEGNDLVLHQHNYTYSVSGNIVTESCTCGHEKKATLSATTGELVYNGNSFNASIAYDTGWVGEQPTEISYTKNTVATSDTTGAGNYIASITIENKIANVTYKIEKATPTDIPWPTKLSGNVGDKLGSIVLENGFVWSNPNEIIDYERKDYVIRYELDRENYNSVTDLISVKAIDEVAPTGEISIGTNHWSTFLSKITFGLFFKKTQTVTITTKDNEYGSGVNEVCYYLATEEKTQDELTDIAYDSWKEYKDAFNINPNRKYIIYVRICDAAANETFVSSEGIVMDNVAPAISGITDGATYCGAVEVTVTDAYLDKVTVGGVETTVTNGKFTVSHTNGTQEIKAYDKAGNVTTYTIRFDNNHIYNYDESTADTIVEKCQRCNYSASAQIKKPTDVLVYNGSVHNATVVYTGTLSCGYNLEISYGTATDTIDAGDYTASITLGGKTASVSYTVEKAKVTPPTINSKVYTGKTLTADVSETDLYTVTSNLGGKNVAAYDVVLTLKDGDNYKWDATEGVDGDKITLKFQISKVANEWTKTPAMEGWTYGEAAKVPTGTAKFIEGDYGITYYDKNKNPIGNPSNAGSYYAQIFVAATDDFNGLTSEYLPFTIEKATPTADIFEFTAPTNLNACDGLAKEVSVTVKEGIEGVGSVTIKYFKDGTEITDAPTTVGTYTVKIEVAEGANYFKADSLLSNDSWTFTFDIADEADHTGVTLVSNGNGTHNKVCTVCEKVIENDAACDYKDNINADYIASLATCVSGASYYKSCSCGQVGTDVFEYGDKDMSNHTKDTFTYLDNGNGTHTKKNECCGTVVEADETHTYGAGNTCNECGYEKKIDVTPPADSSLDNTPPVDSGDKVEDETFERPNDPSDKEGGIKIGCFGQIDGSIFCVLGLVAFVVVLKRRKE